MLASATVFTPTTHTLKPSFIPHQTTTYSGAAIAAVLQPVYAQTTHTQKLTFQSQSNALTFTTQVHRVTLPLVPGGGGGTHHLAISESRLVENPLAAYLFLIMQCVNYWCF